MMRPASWMDVFASCQRSVRLASATIGQWLEFRPVVLRHGRTLAFTECHVLADGELAARASATSPSCHIRPAAPVGATTRGSGRVRPSKLLARLRWDTSLSTAGASR